MTDRGNVVELRITDAEPFRFLIDAVSDAAYRFAELTPDELAALPPATAAGIKLLRDGIARFTGGPAAELPPGRAAYRGEVIIEWPAPHGDPRMPMIGTLVAVYDAATGEPVTTVSSADITVHADAGSLVTANLVLLADEEGDPILDGPPVVANGHILTGVFPYLVTAMRIREPGLCALPAAGHPA
jgi:hypothetical protein